MHPRFRRVLTSSGNIPSFEEIDNNNNDNNDDNINNINDNIDTKSTPAMVSCVLEQGDGLFIPLRWWHYMRTQSLSCSVNYWWK